MIIAAVVLLALGSITTIGSIALEIKHREPHYALMMKLCPLLIGVGGVILALAIAND